MTHTKNKVVQYNDYYPFGLQTANSWTRENVNGNNFLYNAGSELNKTTSNYEMFFRDYDPALGRMTSVDPMASKYSSLTPYNYAFNDPVTYNDPMGDDSHSWVNSYRFDGGKSRTFYDAHAGMFGSGVFGSAFVRYGPGGGYGGSGAGAITQSGNTWTINWNQIGQFGGTWNYQSGYRNFTSSEQALAFGVAYNNRHNSWGYTEYGSAEATEFAYIWAKATGSAPVRETVNYWINTRNSIVSSLSNPIMIASTGKMFSDPDFLGFLKKSSMLALRIALHLPDAFSISIDIDLAMPTHGADISPFGAIFIMQGPARGQSVYFGDASWAQGVDISVAIKLTEFYYTGDVNTLTANSFRGWRISANGAFTLGGLDFGLGLTYAPNTSSENFLGSFNNAMIGISRSIGYGVSVPFPVSGNLNLGYTWLWRDLKRN